MKHINTLPIANTLAFVVMVAMNYLANALPLNGKNTGELSDAYPNLFVPAGLTFSIWGVIYLLLFLWLVGQWLKKDHLQEVEQVGGIFILSCLLNSLWIIAWHWMALIPSLLIMLSLFATLIAINLRIRQDRKNTGEITVTKAAFGIYQGWLSIALIANMTALLVNAGWRGAPLTESIWTIILMIIGALIALSLVIGRHQIWHGVAVAWALLGIYLKRSALSDAPTVAQTAFGLCVGLLIAVLYQMWRSQQKPA